jgi:hypothetical protein
MDLIYIGLIILGACASTWGVLRFVSSRRRVLAPGEIPSSNGLLMMIAGDVALAAGILLLVR